MRCLLLLIVAVMACSAPQRPEPEEKKKPTRNEMCADPKTAPSVRKMLCE